LRKKKFEKEKKNGENSEEFVSCQSSFLFSLFFFAFRISLISGDICFFFSLILLIGSITLF